MRTTTRCSRATSSCASRVRARNSRCSTARCSSSTLTCCSSPTTKKPLGLAGIMGGEHCGIGDDTTTVFLEGAFWNPAVIQGKARRLGFATDAGYRFERGVDFAASRRRGRARDATDPRDLRRAAPARSIDVRGTAAAARSGARAQRRAATRLLGIDDPARRRSLRSSRASASQPRARATTSSSRRRRIASISRSKRISSRRSRGCTAIDDIPARPRRTPQAMLPAPESLRSAAATAQRGWSPATIRR